jgi:rubrerythrin
MITKVTDKVRQSPPSWQNALKLAMDLEEKLARFHMDSVAVYDDTSINNLFKSMMSCDEQHVQSLRSYLDRAEAAKPHV